MDPGLTQKKLLKNRPLLFCLYSLLKVVDHYELRSVHVGDGFPKKFGGDLYPFFWGIFGIFLTLQSPAYFVTDN